MDQEVLIGLVNNTALLLALVLIYDTFSTSQWKGGSLLIQFLTGLILGGIAVAVMATPVKWSHGVIFDTRTVLLGVTGLFFNPFSTAVAVAIAAAYRLNLGGGGAAMGIATIITSGFAGIFWQRARGSADRPFTLQELYVFGIVVHLMMIVSMTLLPTGIVLKTMAGVGIPVIILYPVATALLGSLLSGRTARHRAELALKESEAHFRELIEQAPDAIVIYDLELDRFVDGNQAAEKLFACPRETLLKVGFRQFLSEEQPDSASVEQTFPEHIRDVAEGRPLLFYRNIRNADGMERFCEVRLSLLPTESRKLLRTSFLDVSDRKNAEADREKLLLQMAQTQKMEAIGRLAGGVAHDFNNMLGVILGHTELALAVTSDEALKENLEAIRDASKRSVDITRQLLAFARKQTIAPETLDLNSKIESLRNMLTRLIGEDINLSWRPGVDLWPVKMDHSQVDQMLLNLATNARDAISGTGNLVVRTENAVVDELQCSQRRGFKPGRYVLLTVSDDGCGMDSKTVAAVFEPFYTTKEVGKGTGLGLSTLYGIVKQNGGFVYVRSEPGKGTTFDIYLQRAEESVRKFTRSAPPKAERTARETILLVEDEPANLALGARYLASIGYTVLSAASPKEALELLEEGSGPIDLLITDVVMPGMNGRELAEILTASYPSMKCLFVSGYTANVIAKRGILEDGVHFMQKPYELKEFSRKVGEVLESRTG